VARGADPYDGGSYQTGQEESAVHLQWADVGLRPVWMRPGRFGFEKYEFDSVFVCTARGWWLWLGLPPQHRAPAGGDADHEG